MHFKLHIESTGQGASKATMLKELSYKLWESNKPTYTQLILCSKSQMYIAFNSAEP
jgi:hypothetical protein